MVCNGEGDVVGAYLWISRLPHLRGRAERYDRALLVAALADLVSGKILGVAPLTAVALSVKVGVDTLCGGTEAADAADE